MQKVVYIALGSNLGDRDANLRSARERLHGPDFHVVRSSSVYETEARDAQNRAEPSHPWFYNQVVEAETRLMPKQVLDLLLRVEREMGRRRSGHASEPRIIDLDLLVFGDVAMRTKELTLPHPRMGERRFVLEPLAELAPDLRIPVPPHSRTLRTVRELLAQVMNQSVRRL